MHPLIRGFIISKLTFPSRGRDFSLCHCICTGYGVHSGSYPVNEYWGLFFLGIKQLDHEADHSPPSSARIKTAWICTSSTLFICME
jgi:hypothetical protein